MLRLGFVSLIALLGISRGLSAQVHDDFSGTWKMDAARSESAHQDVPTGSSTVTIQPTGTGMTMETIRSEGGKPFHETLNLKVDGTETTSVGDGGGIVTAKAHWDGAKLVSSASSHFTSPAEKPFGGFWGEATALQASTWT